MYHGCRGNVHSNPSVSGCRTHEGILGPLRGLCFLTLGWQEVEYLKLQLATLTLDWLEVEYLQLQLATWYLKY